MNNMLEILSARHVKTGHRRFFLCATLFLIIDVLQNGNISNVWAQNTLKKAQLNLEILLKNDQ